MKIRDITEQRVDEFAPIAAAAARWLIMYAIRKGGVPLVKWLAKKAVKWGLIGAGAVTAADWTWDKITEIVGEEAAAWLMQNKVEIAVVAVLIVAAAALKRYIENKMYSRLDAKEMSEMFEAYKQKAGDYARPGVMPAKKKRGPHPLGGKLVG